MKLVPSTLADVPTIMKIIGDAQRYLAHLKIDQWQDGYPTEEQIRLDIANNDSYVIIYESKLIGTTVFTFKNELAYNQLEGEWLTQKDATYGVIHRLAVDDDYRKTGLAKFVFDECEKMVAQNNIESLRIDTHRDNKGMQHMLKKRGYSYCGVIILESGDERLAFEKMSQ
jgi:ribosomal protein S18 acetylase RimI-like enzyme